MKQVRASAKDAFKGTEPLEKFGRFADAEEDAPHFTPTATVAEEHVPPQKSNLQFSFEVPDSDEDDEDVLGEFFGEYDFDFDAEKSHDVPTEEEIQALAAQLDEAARKPPPAVPDILEPPSFEEEEEEQESGLSPLARKRKRSDPTPTPSTSSAQAEPEPITEAHTDPTFEEPPPEITQASGSGSSSAQGPPGGDPNLQASIRLAQHLAAEDSARPSSQTGIHIGAGKGKGTAKGTDELIAELQEEVSVLKQQIIERDVLIGSLDVKMSDLLEDNQQKTKQIFELQANLGGLTALVYDMRSRFSQKFGDESGSAAASTTRTSGFAGVSPAPDVTLEHYMSSDPVPVAERREKMERLKKKGKTLVMKSSDLNAPADAPQMVMTNLEKQRFADKYGDRSGVLMWGFDEDKNAWVVKRKSGKIEYYAKMTDFMSWTRVDLSELIEAPFHNPSNNRRAWDFKKFLEIQKKKKFESMVLPSSFTKKAKGVIDPRTEKTMVNVMWPPTKKMKSIPVSKPVPDGSLDSMEFWVYDEGTSTVVIKLKKGQVRIVDPRDLLKFRERDIHTLANHQLRVTHDLFEDSSKVFTSMVAAIINKKLWAGALAATTDVDIVDL